MSENLLEKVITTTHIGNQTDGRGLLTNEQSRVFRDYMDDKTTLLSRVRNVTMTSDVQDIDKIGIGKRLLRGATEAVDDGINVGVAFSKVSLTAVKLRLDWELTEDTLEDNIEGRDLEDHVARLMAGQIGEDLEDLAINGNQSTVDPLLGFLDGWGTLGKSEGNVVDFGGVRPTVGTGQAWTSAAMSRLLRAIPRRTMKNRRNLQFLSGGDFVQDHMDAVAAAATSAQSYDVRQALSNQEVVEGPYGFSVIGNGGVRLHEVPLMEANEDATADVWLTDPQNLVWGIRRAITVHREFKPKKDAIEYTVFVKVAANVENHDALVIGTNLPVGIEDDES